MIILLSICISNSGTTQDTELKHVQQLSISNGLAHNGITSIFKDSRGFIWIGTFDGLHMYDGINITVHKNTVGKEIFVSNRIRTIAEDSKGRLIIGTDEGFSIYNYDLDVFRTLKFEVNPKKGSNGPIIRKIIFFESHDLLVAATEDQGVLIFDTSYNFIEQFLPDFKSDNIEFNDGVAISEKEVLFSTSEGLILFDILSKQGTPILPQQISRSRSLFQVNKNELIVAVAHGINVITYNSEDPTSQFSSSWSGLKAHEFTSTGIDKNNQLWLGTLTSGLLRIDEYELLKTGGDYKVHTFKNENTSLRIGSIYFAYDKCWLGTFNKGLYQFETARSPFQIFNEEKLASLGILSSRILSCAPYGNDKVLLSFIGGGLELLDTEENKLQKPSILKPKNKDFTISRTFTDKKNNLWLLSNEDAGIYMLKNGQTRIKQVGNTSFYKWQQMQIRLISEDSANNLFLGGATGLIRLKIDDQAITNIEYLNDNPLLKEQPISNVWNVFNDTINRHLWIGTKSQGLYRIKDYSPNLPLSGFIIDNFTYSMSDTAGLASNFVSVIRQVTPENDIWIGMERGGIAKIIESENGIQFKTYSENEGLSNNVVKNILQDDSGALWISTNIGLNKFDITTQQFRIIDSKDGLEIEDFEFTAQKIDNGTLLFAGLTGFCHFKPDDIVKDEAIPVLAFTMLKLLNKRISPKEEINGRIILAKGINQSNKLTLKHNENIFSIGVSSLHFNNPKNHFIQYKLAPLNDNWVKIPSDITELNYNGLAPGDYNLYVRASNSMGEWSEVRSLQISILPPFWKTKLAYFLYVLLLASAIGVIIIVILRIQKLNHTLQIEKIEKDNIKSFNAMKLQLFSNISHEIKTPISLISGPISLLLDRFSGNREIAGNLLLIKKQTVNISELVDQVHDFQKAEANVLKLKKRPFEFYGFMNGLISDFNFIANSQMKNLEFNPINKDVHVLADKDKVKKIINNIVSNAFKYTDAEDTISISYEVKGVQVSITISDTGKGISEEDLPHIFERFYRSEKNPPSHTGTGIGLAYTKRLLDMHLGSISVESELNQGSSFTVNLPIVVPTPSETSLKLEKEILAQESQQLPVLDRSVDLTSVSFDEDFSSTLLYVIEDNPDLNAFLFKVLSKFFKVQSFLNPKKCLEAMEKEWPDIVISDVLMPEMNGFDLVRRLKSDIKTSHIPIILLTACGNIGEQIKGVEVGAELYIQKPFDIQHLILSTVSVLRRHQKLRERFKIDSTIGLNKNVEAEKDRVFLDKLFELIAENLDNQDLNLDSLAMKLYLNRTHFYQKVKALTNQTPYELLKSYRLRKAAELLVQENLSVHEVYTMTGFKSRTHFSKLFKKQYKVSPSKYKS